MIISMTARIKFIIARHTTFSVIITSMLIYMRRKTSIIRAFCFAHINFYSFRTLFYCYKHFNIQDNQALHRIANAPGEHGVIK